MQRPGRPGPLPLGAGGGRWQIRGKRDPVLHSLMRACILKGTVCGGEDVSPLLPSPQSVSQKQSVLHALGLTGSTSALIKTRHPKCERCQIPMPVCVVYTFNISVGVISPK